MRTVLLVCLAISLVLTACAAESSAVASVSIPRSSLDASEADIVALIDGNNAFAFDLFQAICDGEENLLFSPFSISQALAMTYAGARGQTAQQMADTLHFTLPQEQVHAAFNALDQALASRANAAVPDGSSDLKLETAFELHAVNAVWGQQGLAYGSEFLTTLAENYGSGVRLVDLKYNPDAAVQQINRWVSEETAGRIPELVQELQPGTGLVVVNAIYFNAVWELPFKENATQEQDFHLLDGRAISVPMMYQQRLLNYTEGNGYQAVELPYRDGKVAMAIILPGEDRFRELEQQMTGTWLQHIVAAFDRRDVVLTMPKFTYEPDLPLTDILPVMGMRDAFDETGDADFSGMLEDYYVYLGEVLHKSFIDVNEERTEAAAATEVELIHVDKEIGMDPIPPVEMRIDRPFIYVIRDIETNAILFVGRLMNPAE